MLLAAFFLPPLIYLQAILAASQAQDFLLAAVLAFVRFPLGSPSLVYQQAICVYG